MLKAAISPICFALLLLQHLAWGQSPPVSDYPFPNDHLVHINSDELGACFAIVALHDFATTYSDFHHLTRTTRHKYSTAVGFFDVEAHILTPFMRYLAGDTTRPLDYSTGNELKLRDWVMAQPNASINHVTLFRESMRLSRGDIWDAVITIHELLRDEARYYDYPRYQYRGQKPIQDAHFYNHFRDTRGDLKERGKPFTGDHAGGWYRIWAGILLRLQYEDSNHFDHVYGPHLNDCPRPDQHPWIFAPYWALVDGVGKVINTVNSTVDLVQSQQWTEVASDMGKADGTFNSLVGRERDFRKAMINAQGSDSMDSMFLHFLSPPQASTLEKKYLECINGDYIKRGGD